MSRLDLDCLKVIRGPGGGMDCSSRLRFAPATAAAPPVASLEGVRDTRNLSDL